MTDTKDLIRKIEEHTAKNGGENTAAHLLVQAVMALQRQADELAAIGAGGVSGPLMGGAALAAPQQAAPAWASITLDFKQATELLEMFGGEACEVTLMSGDGHLGRGIYAMWAADPEGTVYLGETDEDAAPQQAAPAVPYSIDADPQGIRATVADAITGALAFGAQGANMPPTGHWLAPFWESARWEAIRAKPVHPSADTLYLLRRLLSNQHTLTGSEFRAELGKIVEDAHAATPPAQPAPQQEVQEPTVIDRKTMELAESVGLIGPASRVGDLHAAIQRFHDLICVDATIKAAVMAADAIRGAARPSLGYPPLPMQFACSGVFPVYSADQMRAYVDADRAVLAAAPQQEVQEPTTFHQVYRCKIKSRKQIDKEIPREQQGWWADVSAGQTLLLRQAVQSDLDRCTLGGKRSKNPDDYMCETHTSGSLVSKIALEYMNPVQNVFASTAQPAPSGDAWTPVAERLPEPQTPVLLDIGKQYPIRAMWVPKGTLPVGLESDTGFGEYDEGKDEYFCPEGWYEWNQHEECHWAVSEKPLAWCELPVRAQGDST